jgi:hypothetical protein
VEQNGSSWTGHFKGTNQSGEIRGSVDGQDILFQTKTPNVPIFSGHIYGYRAHESKAWSQNLGLEKVLTTFVSYGGVACDRQGEILRGLVTTVESQACRLIPSYHVGSQSW